jgi:hypothetical protein
LRAADVLDKIMNECGAVYVVFGANAQQCAAASIRRLDMPCVTLGDSVHGVPHVTVSDVDRGGRWAKLWADRLSPFEYTLLIDADTIPRASVKSAFDALRQGFDLAMAFSCNQHTEVLRHLTTPERRYTLDVLSNPCPLQLQAGVLFFRRSERIHALFAAWRAEWLRYRDKDQGALLRALARVPLKIWLLGLDWNSVNGRIITHRFGLARR